MKLEPSPSVLVATLGGAVGVVLLSSILHLTPAFGAPLIDVPRLLGGVLTSDPGPAFGLGFALLVIGGWLVFPVLLAVFWSDLPGGDDLGGAALKGLLWGTGVWLLAGLLLPLAGAMNRIEALPNPGVFGIDAGWAALALLIGHLAYGLALGLVSALDQAISPLDTIGWKGYRTAERRPAPLRMIPPGQREPGRAE